MKLTIIILTAMILSLVGCGSNSDISDNQNTLTKTNKIMEENNDGAGEILTNEPGQTHTSQSATMEENDDDAGKVMTEEPGKVQSSSHAIMEEDNKGAGKVLAEEPS